MKGILEGKTYQQVADDLGYSSRGTVHRIVQNTLARHEIESVEELRALELARLDHLQAAFYPAAVTGDVNAAETVLRIMGHRYRLLQLHRLVSSEPGTADPVLVVGGTKEEFINALRRGQERDYS